MTDQSNPELGKRVQYAAYAVLSFSVTMFVVILLPAANVYFERYFGPINAVAVTVAASIAGGGSLWVLQAKYEFVLFQGKKTLDGIRMSAVLATVLGAAIVIADLIIRYPRDINVPFPQALLFYPAIGLTAEVVFHIVPLTMLLFMLTHLCRRLRRSYIIWISIILVAIIEPTFQVLFGIQVFTWDAAYTWIHVFAIAFLQLYVFQRFDFMSMFAFRLFYYIYWHIIWGVIRLDVLFKQ